MVEIVINELAGTYPKLPSNIDQLVEVCPGASVKALKLSPTATACPPKVPATETYQKSPFNTAPPVPEPPVVGNKFVDAL